MSYHLHLLEWISSNSHLMISVTEDDIDREKGAPVHCWWECNLVQPSFQKVWSAFLPFNDELKIFFKYKICNYEATTNRNLNNGNIIEEFYELSTNGWILRMYLLRKAHGKIPNVGPGTHLYLPYNNENITYNLNREKHHHLRMYFQFRLTELIIFLRVLLSSKVKGKKRID